jgi:hypothetical protein
MDIAMKTPSLLPCFALALAAGCYPDASKLQAPGDAAADAASDAPLENGDAGADSSSQEVSGPDGYPVPPGLTDLSPAGERCKFLATSYCTRFQQCSSSWFQVSYLDFADCERNETSECLLTAELPGSTYPTVPCAQGHADLSCALLSAGEQPKACYSPGSAIEGQDCSDEHQCQGRRCLSQPTGGCGKCTRRATLYEACERHEDCVPDLFCYQKVCVDASATACGAAPCKPGLRCDSNGQCVPPSTEGSPCNVPLDCDIYNGLYCETENLHKCVKYTVDPQSCGQNPDGSFVFCADDMFCRNGTTCQANAQIGEACDKDKGPNCEYPASCDSSTLKCRLPALDPTCGPPPPISGAPTNMAAEISGTIIGYPDQDNEAYRRKLKVTVLDPAPKDLSVGEVWGLSTTEDNLYLPIPVTNNGQDIVCVILAIKIAVFDASENELGSAIYQELAGSVQRIETIWTSSCLRPGETGYLLSSVSAAGVSTRAASLRITFNPTAYGSENVVRVTPMSYEASTPGLTAQFTVKVQNTGTLFATLDTGSRYLVLDDIGPVALGFLSAPSPARTLAPGENAPLTTPDLGGLSKGHGTRVRVFIHLKKPDS